MSRFPNGLRAGACWCALILSFSLVLWLPGLVSAQTPCPIVEACFSPKGNCAAVVIREIDAAKKEILMQAYSLTLNSISKGLFGAKGRGVDVRVIVDKKVSVDVEKELKFLDHAGVSVRIDRAHTSAHNKVFVFDGGCVITGTNNFAKKGDQKNAENIVVIVDKKTAIRYSENFNLHWAHSKDYSSKVSP